MRFSMVGLPLFEVRSKTVGLGAMPLYIAASCTTKFSTCIIFFLISAHVDAMQSLDLDHTKFSSRL